MPNFSIALTGLQANTIALNTIGDNLANLNTTGFKKQTTTFEDLFYQTVGSSGASSPLQVGVGTRVEGTASSFAQGSLSTTQSATDMAINGAGFFLVQRGNTQALTRAGNFQLDAAGHLITANGENVMGYGVTGASINRNGGLVALQLPVLGQQPAKATMNIGVTTTLDSTAVNGTTFSSPVTVFDSLGQSHDLTVKFTRSSSSSWTYAISMPAGQATGTPVNATGTLSFDPAGKLVSPAANVAGVTFPGLSDGANDLTFNFNLYDSLGAPTLTQTAGSSTTAATTQDGYAAGSYQSFSVDGDGVVSAAFSNGHTLKVGQVAVASVANTAGLVRAGSNDYTATDASGAISVDVAKAGGRGSINSDALEQSNVDISAEFSDLIVAQRAFEANSKTMTTFDAVTQQAINMIR